MSETPDFEKLPRRVALYFSPAPNGDALDPHAALRLVWNARGAADMATLEATVPDTISFTPGGLVKQLDRALRSLDR